jgi:hypothetical protein
MKQITFFLITVIFFSISSIAQTTIQGNVTDEISPLEWANIYIKNESKGTTSNEKGNFTLDAKKGDTLVISYTGYQTKEIVINNQKFLPVTLDNESLDEVVITGWSSRTVCHWTNCYWSTEIIEEVSEDFSYSVSTPTLYPNPSSDGIFNLKMADTHKEVQVYVTNILGQQVQSRVYQNTNNRITLDLSSLRTGIYLINSVADGEPLATQKAIRR